MKLLALLAVVVASLAQAPAGPPQVLPDSAVQQLTRSLTDAGGYRHHLWRDVPPINADGTVNAYIEIFRGDRRKWEFDIRHNRRAIDRVMPRALGGYPVNYGFVPQTISYDGDPFDALVLGPPMRGGTTVRGAIVGIMHMEDEKGLDSKVVLSPLRQGRPKYALTDADRARMTEFFNIYKRHEPGKFSRVLGWGSREDGLAFVRQTHQFFSGGRSQEKGADGSFTREGEKGRNAGLWEHGSSGETNAFGTDEYASRAATDEEARKKTASPLLPSSYLSSAFSGKGRR